MDEKKKCQRPECGSGQANFNGSEHPARTRRMAKWRHHPFVAALTHAAIQTPRKVGGPRRKICGMFQLAFHKVQHTSPGLACSPDKAKLRCWAPQAGSVAEEAPPAKTTPPQSRSPDSTCRQPLPLPNWQTQCAGSLSHCQNGRLARLSVSPPPSRRSLASQFHFLFLLGRAPARSRQTPPPPRALGGDSFGEGNEEEEPLGPPPLYEQQF